MKSLLKSSTQRHLALIEYLSFQDDWVTITHISEVLNSSTRIIKNDIVWFNNNFPSIRFETTQAGVRILMDQTTGIQEFYRTTLRQSLIFQLLEEIFFDESLTVNELANRLDSSQSTIYRAIEMINNYFSNDDCVVETNPCRMIGDEQFIRNFYRTYFNEGYTVFEWPFKNINEELTDERFNSILSLTSKGSDVDDSFIDFAFYQSIKLMVSVNKTRYQHGHLIDTSQDESPFLKLLIKGLTTFVIPSRIQDSEDMPMNTEYIFQIYYPYLKRNGAFSVDALDKLRKKNKKINTALSYLEEKLTQLSKYLDIEIEIPQLLVSLYGTVFLEEHDPNGMYILYNRNKMFAQTVKQQFPFTYQNLYSAVVKFRELLKLEEDEEKSNYLFYILFTNWDNLLRDLYKSFNNLSILVLSDDHHSHADMIANRLSFELKPNIDIDTFNSRTLSTKLLQDSNYDMIVTTFKLPQLENKVVLMVEDYLTDKDVTLARSIVEHLVEKKKLELLTKYQNYSLEE